MTIVRPSELLDRLPHRPPFRFITSDVQLVDGRQGLATWRVTGDEFFLSGHFPGVPIVPGVLIGEALAQLSGLVALDQMDREKGPEASSRHQGKLAHIELRFNKAVAPPAEIRLESRLTRIFASLWQFEVSARVADVTVARGDLALSITGSLADREATRP